MEYCASEIMKWRKKTHLMQSAIEFRTSTRTMNELDITLASAPIIAMTKNQKNKWDTSQPHQDREDLS